MEAPETQGKRTVFMILVSSCVFLCCKGNPTCSFPRAAIINDAYCDRSMTRDYDREALNAFFATLKEEDFEVVVVRSLNEITDDIYDLEEFVKTITDMGIWLYSLEVGPVPITVSHAEDFRKTIINWIKINITEKKSE